MTKKRGARNIMAALISQFFTIALGIIIPRLVLVNLGSESNGLLNSVATAISYMSLLEAGVGTATLQALYLPVSKNDRDSVSRIMSATNYFYRRTGRVYFIIVLVIACSFTGFARTNIPKYEVFFVVLLAGLSGVLNYFFQGKFKILLDAEGKSYITTNLGTIVQILVSVTKALVLLLGGNVVAVQAVYFIYNLAQMFVFVLYMKRHYSWVDYKSTPDFEAISQKNAVLLHQISQLIFNNTDILILTLLTNFKEVSVYSMYGLIYGMVKSITVTTDGYLYALGQSFQDRHRFIKMFDSYEVIKIGMTASFFCITHILILPFLRLYTSGVNDINYIDYNLPWLFSTIYLLHNGRQSSGNLINIAQRFEDTKWRSVLESVINLVASIVLTIKYGIYGVLFGTILALLYRTNDMIIYAAHILERSPLITYRRWISNVVLFFFIATITSKINMQVSNYFLLIFEGLISAIIIIPLFIAINVIIEPNVTRYLGGVIKEIFLSRFGAK